MNTKILSYILAIAETKSVSKAAERFYLAQPVLSLHLKKLETELGTPLFSRTKNGMIPTRAGVIFLNDAQAILHRQKQLEDQLELQRRKNKNLLRIMVDRSYYSHFVRRAMPILKKARPELELEITSCNASQARRALAFGEAELGIFTQVGALTEELEGIPILRDAYVIAFSPDYRGDTTLAGLAHALEHGSNLVLHDIGSTFRMLEEECLAKAGIIPTFILEQNTFVSTMELLQDGGYCCFLPREMTRNCSRLKVIPGTPVFDFQGVLAYRPGVEISDDLLQELGASFRDFPESIRKYQNL